MRDHNTQTPPTSQRRDQPAGLELADECVRRLESEIEELRTVIGDLLVEIQAASHRQTRLTAQVADLVRHLAGPPSVGQDGEDGPTLTRRRPAESQVPPASRFYRRGRA
jgi:hypothetical protein